jgi:signal peptidase I
MFSFFEPAYIKEARLVLKNARKLLHYKKDILTADSRGQFEETIDRLEAAIRAKDRAAVEETAKRLDDEWGKYLPPAKDAGMRENCEVFLVAIVIAIGVRTFFLQPFTIPTGSMQPTLNGIIGHPSNDPAPNVVKQVIDFALYGRNYINVVAKSDEKIVQMNERKMLFFFTLTDVQCEHNSYTIWAPMETLYTDFGLEPGRPFQAGDVIARGAVDAGDHVFVDKVSYNFRAPDRGEVFVFSTQSIPRIEEGLRRQGIEGSEFYIKRLVGLPGDTLREASPLLYINGREAQEFGMQRVMSAKDGYGGYGFDIRPNAERPIYLTAPNETYTVPPHHFFAMGDNSHNSSDGRYWGPVPGDNLMGRGLFVYWPFLPHFGFVK